MRYEGALMRIRSLLLCLMALLNSQLLAADPTSSLEQANENQMHPARVEVFDDNRPTDDNKESPSEEDSSPSSIERFVQPFTRWAEDQIHDTGLIRSPQVQENSPPQQKETLTLREAIQHATQRYPGTVLSANKVKSEETLSYQIKIISTQGVVKTIIITEPNNNNKGLQ